MRSNKPGKLIEIRHKSMLFNVTNSYTQPQVKSQHMT